MGTDPFRGTTALVTGASSGLGVEFARQLAARGVAVVLTARREDRLRALAAQLGPGARVVPGDLAAPGGAAALARAVDALGVPIDHLVNNAGFGLIGPLARASEDRLAEMVRLNCEALTVLCRHYVAGMLERGRGGVLNVASVAGFQPMPFTATYAASKAYVLALSAALAEELRGTPVRVCAACPGPVPTEFQAVAGSRRHSNPFKSAVLTAEETVRRSLAAYEAGRAVYVPGAVNRLTAAATTLAPRGILVRAVGHIARKHGRAD